MLDLKTQVQLAQAKSDFLVFGSSGILGASLRDHKISDIYGAAENAIRTGERRALGSSRVREAVLGHALSALMALMLSRYLHSPSRPAGERRTPVFDALSFLPAVHAALLHKHEAALALLGLQPGTGHREVSEMFAILGVQTFLFAPLPSTGGEVVGADLIPRLKTLPGARIADGVGSGSLRKWYREAKARDPLANPVL